MCFHKQTSIARVRHNQRITKNSFARQLNSPLNIFRVRNGSKAGPSPLLQCQIQPLKIMGKKKSKNLSPPQKPVRLCLRPHQLDAVRDGEKWVGNGVSAVVRTWDRIREEPGLRVVQVCHPGKITRPALGQANCFGSMARVPRRYRKKSGRGYIALVPWADPGNRIWSDAGGVQIVHHI